MANIIEVILDALLDGSIAPPTVHLGPLSSGFVPRFFDRRVADFLPVLRSALRSRLEEQSHFFPHSQRLALRNLSQGIFRLNEKDCLLCQPNRFDANEATPDPIEVVPSADVHMNPSLQINMTPI